MVFKFFLGTSIIFILGRFVIKDPKNFSGLLTKKIGAGNCLIIFLNNLISDVSVGTIKNGPTAVPFFKFYTGAIQTLMGLRVKFGADVRDPLFKIRNVLQEDLHFEEELKREVQGSYFQMFILAGFTWIFVISSKKIGNISVEIGDLKLILLWQILGLFLFHWILKMKKEKTFEEVQLYFETIFTYSVLLTAELPIQKIINSLPLNEIKESKDKSLLGCKEIFLQHVRNFGLTGASDLRSVDMLFSEVKFQQKEKFKSFVSSSLKLKLLFSVAFFFTSYLFYLFLMLNGLQ